jgi:SAM-dependent methyltransferase
MPIDFGLTAGDYARHRAGFPPSFFERISAFGVGRPGQSLVDLGTGTGTLARGFARRGCRVVAIDPSAPMLAQARALDAAESLSVDYRLARAEETGLARACTEVVTAGQCWHWFDRARAAAEVARILRDDGAVVIAHFDWIPVAGNVVQATEALIEAHNPSWKLGGGSGLHPEWLRDLAEAGFRGLQTFSYDEPVPYTAQSWRGRVRASAGVAASLGEAQVAAFDADLAQLLESRFPADLLEVPHRVFAVVARAPGRS